MTIPAPKVCAQQRRWQRSGAILNLLLLACLPAPGFSASENLQPCVDSLMHRRHGAVIVSNPATGQLLAVWNPSGAWNKAYPPGSTAKLVVAAAALEEGVIAPSERNFCHRIPELLGDAYHCSHPPPDGPYTLASAFSNSCNYFFSALSVRLTSAQLAHWYAAFGFGSPVPGVGSMATAGEVRVGDSSVAKALAALGEKSILVTPAQLLLAYSAVATRGAVFRLWQSDSGGIHPSRISRRIKLQPKTFELLKSALIDCVQSGTGQEAAVEGVPVAGKTGTATEIGASKATHAWFVGYAPASHPEIAVVVFLERGTGPHDAAPLAGNILKHYFELKDQKP